MKRYKLKKDTPAFKAGTECYLEEVGHMVPCRGISYTIVHKDQLAKNPNILDDWFEEIKPKEPLIKDEKIRKAVRAWAEANEISQAQFNRYTSGFSASDAGNNLLPMISFDGFVLNCEDGEYYTIDELCGEEEE